MKRKWRKEVLALRRTPEAARSEALASSVQGNYFLTVSRRTGLPRLHVVGSCHVRAERCQQVVDVDSLEGQSFDGLFSVLTILSL